MALRLNYLSWDWMSIYLQKLENKWWFSLPPFLSFPDWFGYFFWSFWLNDFSMQRFTTNSGLESMNIISSVVNNSMITISINKWVLSFNWTIIRSLWLAFNISCLLIMNFILEVISGWSILWFFFFGFFNCIPYFLFNWSWCWMPWFMFNRSWCLIPYFVFNWSWSWCWMPCFMFNRSWSCMPYFMFNRSWYWMPWNVRYMEAFNDVRVSDSNKCKY